MNVDRINMAVVIDIMHSGVRRRLDLEKQRQGVSRKGARSVEGMRIHSMPRHLSSHVVDVVYVDDGKVLEDFKDMLIEAIRFEHVRQKYTYIIKKDLSSLA